MSASAGDPEVPAEATEEQGEQVAEEDADNEGASKREHDEVLENEGEEERASKKGRVDEEQKDEVAEAEVSGEDGKRPLEDSTADEPDSKRGKADETAEDEGADMKDVEKEKEGEEEPKKGKPEVGKIVKAKYGDSFFEATVLEVSESTVKLKWKHDDSEADVTIEDVQAEEEPMKGKPEVGKIVKAKYGNSFFEATVLEVGESTLKIKWKHDDSEADISIDDVQAEEEPKKVKPEVGKIVKAKYGNSFFEATVLEVGESTLKIKWKHDDSEADVSIDDLQAEEEVVEEEPEDPAWIDSLKIEVGWEAAAWLLEEDSKYLHKLEELSGADAKVNENGRLRLRLREDAPADDSWAERCAKAMCAFRKGDALELEGFPEPTSVPSLKVIKVTDEFQKGALLGKDNSRVLEMYRDFGVVVVYANITAPAMDWEKEKDSEDNEKPKVKPEVGKVVQGKFGNGWFDATVLEVVSESSVKIKWGFDGSEAELSMDDVQVKDEEPKKGKPEVGKIVKAKNGDSFSEATVLEVGESTVKLKWKHDDSEADVSIDDVQVEEEPKKGKPEVGKIVKAKNGDSFSEATVLEVGESTVKLKWKHDDSEADVSIEDVQVEEEQADEEPKKSKPEVGKIVKAKYGNSFFDATVLEVGESTLKIKWKHDDSEADVSIGDVQAEEEPRKGNPEVGKIVKAKYGNSFFEATVLEVGEGTVKIKWKHDDSEADVSIDDVQAEEEVAAATSEAPNSDEIGPVEEGNVVEGKFGNGWFEAVVIADGKKTIAVKWKHDDSIAALSRSEVRLKEGATEGEKSKLEVGQVVKGKFGNSMFEATVLEVGDSTVKLKWKFDDSEVELPMDEVEIPEAEAVVVPKDPTAAILIFGGNDERSRLIVEMNIMKIVDKKVPGCITPVERNDEGEGIGLTVLPLVNDGEFVSRLIGKQGSKRKIIMRVCECEFEIIGGKFAYVVGTLAQRARAISLFGFLQVKGEVLVDSLPDNLSPIASTARFPKRAERVVLGEQKATLTQVETDCQTIVLFMAPPKMAVVEKSVKLDLSEGAKLEALHKDKGDWLEAEVLKVFMDDDDDADEGDCMVRVKFIADGSEALLPFARLRAKLDGDAGAERRQADDSQKASSGMLSFFIIGKEEDRKLSESKFKVQVEAAYPGSYADGEIVVKKLAMTADEAWKCQEAAARRQSIARATKCITFEVVGEAVYAVGGSAACDTALKLSKTLLEEIVGGAITDSIDDTCNVKVLVPKDKRGNLTGDAIEQVEKETQTFVFFDDGAAAAGLEDEVRAVVYGHTKELIDVAAEKLEALAAAPAWEAPAWEEKKEWDEPGAGSGEIQVGITVQGKYGNGWFDAEVLEVSDSTVKVKWGFDSSEADLAKGDVKLKTEADGGKKDEWEGKEEKKWEDSKEEKKEQSWDKKEQSWDKKEESWDKKEQSWDKKEQSWDKKGDEKAQSWDKKEQSWDKKEESWDKKEQSWDKKEQSWDKREESWDKKQESWDKKEQPWDKKEQSWDKKEQSWDKKEESWDKKEQSWDKKEESWDKKEQSWDKKEQSWDKKDDSWDKKEQSWDKKEQSWDKKGDDKAQSWDKKEESWDKKEQSWDKKEQSWDKKEQSWDKKDEGRKRVAEATSTAPWNAKNEQSRLAGPQGQKRPWNEPDAPSNSRPRGEVVPPRSRPPLDPPRQARPVSRASLQTMYSAPEEEEQDEPEAVGAYVNDVEEEEDELEEMEKANPEEVLAEMAYPKSIQEWHLVQDLVFAGHDPLPEGWIRAWSRSRKCVYYVRMSDNKSVFKLESIE